MADFKRIERDHWMGAGVQVLASHPDHLNPRERRSCPEGLVAAFHAWPTVWRSTPPALSWAQSSLQARTPVLEHSRFDYRDHWALRFPLHGRPEHLEGPCIGSSVGGLECDAPGTLGWLARSLGPVNLCSEWSGTSPWGRRLRDISPGSFLPEFFEPLPAAAPDWWVLYEADGDWLALDADQQCLHWVGLGEWTGEPDRGFQVPPERVLRFVVWRLLDGGFVRPSDLEMLADRPESPSAGS